MKDENYIYNIKNEMWINKVNLWNPNTELLIRFLVERIIQRCDYDESLSNQHRTTNGYIQLKELVKLSVLSTHKGRTIRTLKVLFEEAQSSIFNQNICNDIIIDGYFVDLKKFVTGYDSSKLYSKDREPNLIELNGLIHNLKVFESQLEKNYFFALKTELAKIDYKEINQFERHSKRIASLVDILIPFLTFNGYAVSSLSSVLQSWIKNGYNIKLISLFHFFSFQKRKYKYLIRVNEITELLRTSIIAEIKAPDIKIDKVSSLLESDRALKKFSAEDFVVTYSETDLDPHMHFRSTYDSLLKRLVQQRERQSLSAFNDFFQNCFWKIPKTGKLYHSIGMGNDPINVKHRQKTLWRTLKNCTKDFGYKFESNSDIPIAKNNQIGSSIFYYNLALGSKSIENSLSLLWTALESLLPYRTHFSDIDCIQNFVSKSLSIGSLSRDIYAFAKRLTITNTINSKPFHEIDFRDFRKSSIEDNIQKWFKWIVDPNDIKGKFDNIKQLSDLLAFEYVRIGKPLIEGKLKNLRERILISHDSIMYQTQRIYLHRNQIIHAGNLVNEYTNLWMHLEWYVGKLIAYSVIKIEILHQTECLSDIFIDIEADYDYVMSYLDKNGEKSVHQMSDRLKSILLSYSWQSF